MPNTIRGGAVVYGIAVALLTALLAIPLALLMAASGGPFVASATVLLSFVVLGVGAGAVLAWASGRSDTGRRATPLRRPPAWTLLIAFLVTLAIGAVVLITPLTFILPLVHIVACLLPPLILIAAIANYVQRNGVALSRRDLAAQFAFGAVAATAIAITLESLAAGGAMVAGMVGVTLLPGGAENLQALAELMQNPAVMTSPELLLETISAPALVVGLGLLVAVATPMIEEIVKSLGVPLAARLRPVSRAQAFTFGLIAGAGFSLTEALFYGLAGLPHEWVAPVLTRAATVVIHGAATGLLGIAWYEALHGRTGRFVLYAAAGIGLHGLWNTLGGLLTLAALNPLGQSGSMGQALGAGLSALVVFLLGATWFLALGVIIWQARQSARQPLVVTG
ncbi:MAG: hypothetical protein R2844_07095 [Caldilineales bacterium]